MGVKYMVLYKDNFDNQCRFDISNIDYTGVVTELRGVGQKAAVITWDCSEDPYDVIVNSKCDVSVWQEEVFPINILELQQAVDREYTGQFYVNNVLKWSGFMIQDGIQQTFQAAPFEFNLTFTDGLKLLEGITYNDNIVPGGIGELDGGRCILNYLRCILFSDLNLGLALPIRWVNTLVNPAFPLETDVFSGSVRWSFEKEGFTDYNKNIKSCNYILENILQSMQCRIHQSDGLWKIERINDVVTGSFNYRQTPAVLTGFSISSGSSNINKSIGSGYTYDYDVIQEDAIITVIPALKYIKTTYEQDQRDNILPNGNMDIFVLGSILYWGLLDDETGSVTSYPSLSENRGVSAKIITFPGASNIFSLKNATGQLLRLPIDTDVLYTYINLGFKFSVISGGSVDAEGYIQWGDLSPFTIQVTYQPDDSTFYSLNEFGFWVESSVNIITSVPLLKRGDIANIDFNSKQNIILPLPTDIPIERTFTPTLTINFNLQPDLEIVLDDIYINTDTNSDVYKATSPIVNSTAIQDYALNISSSHNGFYVSNFMTSFNNSGVEKFFSDSKFTGTLTAMNSNAIMRNRYLPSLLFQGSIYGDDFSYNNIYEIYTLTGKKFLPLNTVWNTETNVVNLSCVEVRDDDIEIEIEHYGSNRQPLLSN